MTDPIARAADEIAFLSTMFGSIASKTQNAVQAIEADTEIVILSGFLGAGKTTLLRQILSAENGQKIGVIVNDFGSVNLDADALSESSDGIVSLPNGCSCCTIGAGFTAAVQAMLATPNPPDCIYVEASGVSDPISMMTLAALTGLKGSISVVTLVDCQTFGARPLPVQIRTVFERQIRAAHLVLLTKTAAAGADKTQAVRSAIAHMTEGRMVLDADADHKASQMVLRGQFGGAPPTLSQIDHDTSQIMSRSVLMPKPVSRTVISKLFEQMPETILRLKGSLQLHDGATLSVQAVGQQLTVNDTVQKNDAEHCLVVIFASSDEPNIADWLEALRNTQTEPS